MDNNDPYRRQQKIESSAHDEDVYLQAFNAFVRDILMPWLLKYDQKIIAKLAAICKTYHNYATNILICGPLIKLNKRIVKKHIKKRNYYHYGGFLNDPVMARYVYKEESTDVIMQVLNILKLVIFSDYPGRTAALQGYHLGYMFRYKHPRLLSACGIDVSQKFTREGKHNYKYYTESFEKYQEYFHDIQSTNHVRDFAKLKYGLRYVKLFGNPAAYEEIGIKFVDLCTQTYSCGIDNNVQMMKQLIKRNTDKETHALHAVYGLCTSGDPIYLATVARICETHRNNSNIMEKMLYHLTLSKNAPAIQFFAKFVTKGMDPMILVNTILANSYDDAQVELIDYILCKKKVLLYLECVYTTSEINDRAFVRGSEKLITMMIQALKPQITARTLRLAVQYCSDKLVELVSQYVNELVMPMTIPPPTIWRQRKDIDYAKDLNDDMFDCNL